MNSLDQRRWSLSHQLWRHTPDLVVATLLSILLAILTAVLGAFLGPGMQILFDPIQATMISLKEFLGSNLAPLFLPLFGGDLVSPNRFFALVPLILIAVASGRALAALWQWYLTERVGEIVSKDLRSTLTNIFLISQLDREPTVSEQVATVVTSDIRLAREYLIRFFDFCRRIEAEN